MLGDFLLRAAFLHKRGKSNRMAWFPVIQVSYPAPRTQLSLVLTIPVGRGHMALRPCESHPHIGFAHNDLFRPPCRNTGQLYVESLPKELFDLPYRIAVRNFLELTANIHVKYFAMSRANGGAEFA